MVAASRGCFGAYVHVCGTGAAGCYIQVVKAMMVFWTAGFVLLTLLINAPLLPTVLRLTGLSKVSFMQNSQTQCHNMSYHITACHNICYYHHQNTHRKFSSALQTWSDSIIKPSGKW
jgi:hypothetical protein